MNNRHFVWIVVLLIAFLAYYFLFSGSAKKGEIAPEIESKLLDGSPFKLSDLRGDYVLIDFWGSWCPPCRKENRTLVSFYNKYKDLKSKDGAGFKVLNIAIEKDDQRVKKAIEKDGLHWDLHIVDESRLVAVSPFTLAYKVTDLPSKFLIDPSGTIVASKASFEEIDEILSVALVK